jgi:hypothetical protein
MRRLIYMILLLASCNSPKDNDRREVVYGYVDSIKRVLSAVSSYELDAFYHFTKNDTVITGEYIYCCEKAWTSLYTPGDSVKIVYNWTRPDNSYLAKIVRRVDSGIKE